MKKLVVGYLSYITEKNENFRYLDFLNSVESLKKIDKNFSEIISIDNSSIEKARSALKDSGIFDRAFHYNTNFFDVALFYTTLWYAKENCIDYLCFLYDDFIVYDDALHNVVEFLDKNPQVSCVRIPIYDFYDQGKFDSEITQKVKNPDSIRHYNCVTNKKLNWRGPFQVKQHEFFVNDWHYTSRPTVWRREYFDNVLEKQGAFSKVLQGFEAWAAKAFFEAELVTGVLNGGMVKTTPVDRSARSIELSSTKELNLKIDLEALKKEYKNIISSA